MLNNHLPYNTNKKKILYLMYNIYFFKNVK